ncbi:MAG: hypothetical protein UT63_C0060G0004 [Candidatus Gottesmanbacteria bacterium GW2011_GWC2_39_8]|uniref:Uncharacterized protein n=1 Tax=Candidatus Gottesmanbacteria bacterium GW2011_GWC2_39_8 TaxID=1618450 RepID=A0A0G0Q349_9BACT|nr:MAG: hypothetical protein UT63_C0060G0004 [Candidatus Gottesmanbacteria bacterium GW2011_GWC2_39_8]
MGRKIFIAFTTLLLPLLVALGAVYAQTSTPSPTVTPTVTTTPPNAPSGAPNTGYGCDR